MLDHGAPPERFARGWHCLGLESTFHDGKPHAHRGVRRQAGRLGGLAGQPQRARRLLPAHGRRPDPGHGQGRRDRLPVPRLALGRRRQVQGDPLRPAGPAARAHPEVPHRDPQRPAAGLARHRGLRARLGHPAAGAAGRRTEGLYTDWTWEVVPIEGSHCRELIDNVVDMAHFYYVHFSFPTSFRNVFEGTVATQYMESKGRPDKSRRLRRRRTCSSSPRPPTSDRRT